MTILGKKQMSEEDIKLNYITPVILDGQKGPMDVDMTDNARNRANGTECILCMECVKNCPKNALQFQKINATQRCTSAGFSFCPQKVICAVLPQISPTIGLRFSCIVLL